MKSKFGQIKFGETIGVIIIVYIVIVVGFVWYNSQNSKDIAEKLEEQERNKAFEKYNYVLKLNLIHKSELGYIDEEFDRTSLIVLGDYSRSPDGKEYFRNKLGNSMVEVKLYDLEMTLVDEIVVYNNTPTQDQFKQTSYKTVIPVYDGINDTKYLGVIEVLDFVVKE